VGRVVNPNNQSSGWWASPSNLLVYFFLFPGMATIIMAPPPPSSSSSDLLLYESDELFMDALELFWKSHTDLETMLTEVGGTITKLIAT